MKKIANIFLACIMACSCMYLFVGCGKPIEQVNTTSVTGAWQNGLGQIIVDVKHEAKDLQVTGTSSNSNIEVGISLDGNDYFWMVYDEQVYQGVRSATFKDFLDKYEGKDVLIVSRLRERSEGNKDYKASPISEPFKFYVKEGNSFNSIYEARTDNNGKVIMEGDKTKAEELYYLSNYGSGENRTNFVYTSSYTGVKGGPHTFTARLYKIVWAADNSWKLVLAENIFEYHVCTKEERDSGYYAQGGNHPADDMKFLSSQSGVLQFASPDLMYDWTDTQNEPHTNTYKRMHILIRMKGTDKICSSQAVTLILFGDVIL